ncbi:MAG: hypothetical protein NTZ05_22065 [Chloroflexi bacterium]|nr:hypothetical protein [Chloroflexota bacterium]
MPNRLMLVAAAGLSGDELGECRSVCRQLAEGTGERVRLVVTDDGRFSDAFVFLTRSAGGALLEETFEPKAGGSAAPMSAAPFVYTEDSRPDWGSMWEGFCELALYGGPPHRGEADALRAPVTVEEPDPGAAAIAEIQRGIWETTGLRAEPAEPGWIVVSCDSRKMAAWLCASIILENVDARCEGERLFLPAGAGFTLKDEVKSVITVLAKTNHYWQAHVVAPVAVVNAVQP